ncbi:MAG: glycosyltransferase [Cyclobacteriaceae bacterium]
MGVSIIIPVFNESKIIGHLLKYLHTNQTGLMSEIIVVDGGSTDQTREIARKEGASVILSPEKGRSTQMNLGADYAEGEILFFLHADSFPPKQYYLHDVEPDAPGQDVSRCQWNSGAWQPA